MLGKKSEVSVQRVVEKGGGEEASRRGNKSWGGAFGSSTFNESSSKNTAGRRDFNKRVRVNVDIEEFCVVRKEDFPKRSKVEVGIRKKQKCNLGF